MNRWIVPVSAAVAHGSALGAGYVWLDHAHLEAKTAIAPPSGWLGLFTHGFAGTGYYRPLTALSLSIDALVGSPVLYHAVNLGWHAAAATMTAAVAEMFGRSRRAAIVAGVLFAVHPLGSLVASAIAFRSESMLLTFLLLLVWAHRRHKPALAAGALLGAALTKETGLVLAPLFIMATMTKDDVRRTKANVRLLAGESAAWVVALALRWAFAPAWRASHEALGTGAAIGTRLASLTKSALALVLPFDRTICDAFPVTKPTAPSALAGAAIAGLVIVLAIRRRGPALLLALSLLPSLQLVPVMRWWSPHYLYLALAFVAMIASESVDRLRTSARNATFVVGAAMVILAGVSFLEDRRFASDATLWRREVAAQPACREGQFYLGEVAREGRNWSLAVSRYAAALEPRRGMLAYVDRGATLQNLGTVHLEQARFEEAKDAFRAALAGTTDPGARRELTHDLAVASLRSGDADGAARLLEEETSRPDALPASLTVRAMALEQLGRESEAKALRARVRAE